MPVMQGKLHKVPIGGGPPTMLCDATNRGASWGPDGTIVFATSPTSGLYRVPAAGGTAEPLTTLAPSDRPSCQVERRSSSRFSRPAPALTMH